MGLWARGFVVEAASNGLDALETLKRIHPDLIVTDMQMPKMSGVAFLERLQETTNPCRPFVFVMTGKTVEENLDSYANLGVTETLLKPFSRSALVGRIQLALAEMRRRTLAAQPATCART